VDPSDLLSGLGIWVGWSCIFLPGVYQQGTDGNGCGVSDLNMDGAVGVRAEYCGLPIADSNAVGILLVPSVRAYARDLSNDNSLWLLPLY
jgi:hypothetical protein